jgi:hypothetical protein
LNPEGLPNFFPARRAAAISGRRRRGLSHVDLTRAPVLGPDLALVVVRRAEERASSTLEP